jgi:hypothetical protein
MRISVSDTVVSVRDGLACRPIGDVPTMTGTAPTVVQARSTGREQGHRLRDRRGSGRPGLAGRRRRPRPTAARRRGGEAARGRRRPGFTATDLNGFRGVRTPEQGAAMAIHLATLPDDGPTGGFFDDAGVVPW